MTIQHELVQKLAKDYKALSLRQEESDDNKGLGIGQNLEDVYEMYEQMKRVAGSAITALHMLTRTELTGEQWGEIDEMERSINTREGAKSSYDEKIKKAMDLVFKKNKKS